MFLQMKSNVEAQCVKQVMADPVQVEVGALGPLGAPPPWVLPPYLPPPWPPYGICKAPSG